MPRTPRDHEIDNIIKTASEKSADNIRQIEKNLPFLLRNIKRLYGNTDAEKDLILKHLHKKYLAVKNIPDEVVKTGKNLLYFTVFLDDTYVEMLENLLKSIVANTSSINFDVLFITDEQTKSKIQSFSVISNFNVDYMLMQRVGNGPRASIKKLNIYDYNKINQYEKILFLDVDSLCIKDLNTIFQKEISQEKLYVCSIPLNTSRHLLTVAHGIMHLTKEDAAFIFDNPQKIAFNAGQFLFVNSRRMKMHFQNVIWLQNSWPAQYFYEQSVMNYYFVLKNLTEPMIDASGEYLVAVTYTLPENKAPAAVAALLKNAMMRRNQNGKLLTVIGATKSNFSNVAMIRKLNNTEDPSDVEQMHTESTVVIHFAGARPAGEDKKKFIANYVDAYKLHI